jgi:hypothetical protein
MIEVELPGGTIAEFPDGTPHDVMTKALQQQFAPPAPAEPAAPDVGTVTSLGRGAAQGITLGGYDELRGLAEAGGVKPDEPMSLGSLIRGGYNLLTGSGNDQYEAAKSRATSNLKVAQAQHPYATLGGELGGGVAGALALSPLSLASGAARAGYGLGLTAAGSAIDGAVLGGVQGALSADEGQRLEGAKSGAKLGFGVGTVAPYLTAGASNAFRRMVSPITVSPERQAAAAVLQQDGVPVTAGQLSGSKRLRYAEGELGGNRASDMLEQQGQAFTDAAMRRAGGSGLAMPDNLAALKVRQGQEFDAISARNMMQIDQQFGQDLGQTLNRYGRLLEPQQRPIINNITDDLINRLRANNGTLPGTEYQAIRSDLSLASRSTNNPALAGAFRGIRNAMDDAMERSINQANPADAGRWRELRRQYGNMKVLQRASLGGGEDAGLGIISPARLRMAASSGNAGGFSTGASDFSELVKAGQALMTPLPQSGTAPRLAARNLGTMIPTVLGATAGAPGGIPGSFVGAAAGAALPRLIGALMMSRPGQAYLSNQALAGQMTPRMRAIVSLLLTNSALTTRD